MVAAVALSSSWAQLLLLAMSQKVAEDATAQHGPTHGYVESLQRGDHESWRLLFEEESPAIHRYVYSRLGNSEDAEDVTNHVFEEAWRSIGRYRDEGLPLRAWLFGVARNLAGSHRRRFMSRNAQVSVDALQIEGQPDVAPTEMIDLVDAIASLDASQAETITLRYIHRLSLAETAAGAGHNRGRR